MSKVAAQLERIAGMAGDALRAEWRRVFGTTAPLALTLDLIRLALAYEVQARVSGRLPVQIARHIERQARRGSAAPPSGVVLAAGTRLVRDWHGVSHHVQVTDTGFVYRDRHFASLTAIAKEITGAAWSGPRFFGLVDRAGRGIKHG